MSGAVNAIARAAVFLTLVALGTAQAADVLGSANAAYERRGRRQRHQGCNLRCRLVCWPGFANAFCISEDQTRRKLVTACKKAGIPRLGWHAFRRYFATQTDRNGMRPLDRQNSLGHASQEMTAHYTTEDLERRRPAVKAIAKGLFKERR